MILLCVHRYRKYGSAARGRRSLTALAHGLPYHESDLRIEEHYSDTAGFPDHVPALCYLLSFCLATRIRDLADRCLYVPGKEGDHPTLAPLIAGKLHLNLVRTQWKELLRLPLSIRHGTVIPSLIIRKLAKISARTTSAGRVAKSDASNARSSWWSR